MRKPKQHKQAYDVRVAMWLSRDPIAERGGLNLYGYVFNNPINAIDPLGLDAYIFYNSSGGPDFAPGAGHIGVGVDNGSGGVIRRDAAWNSLGGLLNSPSLSSSAGSDKIIRFPNHQLPDGRWSDDVIRDFMRANKKSDRTYTYCSNYASDVLALGGWDLSGLTPQGLVDSAKNYGKPPAFSPWGGMGPLPPHLPSTALAPIFED